ncbi:sulfotransferase family 2 domain-containing protein [Roseibium polysiphoniae]|uniref:Sulfotransferase family protein n=1 Tax=Roseibium polysiphoniae TaxID=2571221 RepID=A0ABR9CFY4_9HYPH|nr:sulfotransferase family 2 domain-containing protein [Roseibium polysiphoniae]MBD8878784.1 hypothetical protein [Roseibium polysiphoniae]
MLNTLYSVYDRQRRPLRDHHFMVFPDVGLAYARIPGDPYRAVTGILNRLVAGSTPEGTSDDSAQGIDSWVGDIEIVTARQLKRRFPDFCTFAVVQSPAERILSAYQCLIEGDTSLPTYFDLNRFDKSMSLLDFVSHVAAIGDMGTDNLLRSQSAILSHRSKLVPDIVVDLASLAHTPGALLDQLSDRATSPIDLTNVEIDVPDHDPENWEIMQGLAVRAALKQRYKKDYRMFFEEQTEISRSLASKTRGAGLAFQ